MSFFPIFSLPLTRYSLFITVASPCRPVPTTFLVGEELATKPELRQPSPVPGSATNVVELLQKNRTNRTALLIPSLLRPFHRHPKPPTAPDQLVELLGGLIYAGRSSWSLEQRPRLQSSSIFFVSCHHTTAKLLPTWGDLYELRMS